MMVDKNKLRTFCKTWLFINGRCTSSQLADAYNQIGFEKHEISSKIVGAFLSNEFRKKNYGQTTILQDLDWEYEEHSKRKVWFI